ncbi:MAG: sulfatase-like hydrolase/transferase [Vicinamibacterales bacterium]
MMRNAALGAILIVVALGVVASGQAQRSTTSASRPNFVVILTDDMGYADLHMNGNPVINTPNLDQMARDGLHLTSMYSAPLCTPTRGMFLTSRYPLRTGIINVTGPGSPVGIRKDEVTLAQALKSQGYRTAMFGKWHIGDFDTDAGFNPTAHGFDEFLGLPYSHDYNPAPGVPLYHNTEKVEQPVKYNLLTQRYTQEAIKFIRGAKGQPFFAYVAHNLPHIPIGTSDQFKGHSRAGRYGDVIEEIDWSVGQILTTLKQLGIDRNTIVVFMSDNGPWVSTAEQTYDRQDRGTKVQGDVGWPGILRGSKGQTYEGGVRVPAIVRWPGTIAPLRTSADVFSVMDWFPTFVGLAGGKIAPGHEVDGIDITPFLRGKTPSPRHDYFYFGGAAIQALREGPWKVRVAPAEGARQGGAGGGRGAAAGNGGRAATDGVAGAVAAGEPNARGRANLTAPNAGAAAPVAEPLVELFNLDTDPAERFNVAASHPDIVARLRARMEAFGAALRATSPPVSSFVEKVSKID